MQADILRRHPLRPPVRWIGGKSATVSQLCQIAPTKFQRLLEPMAGSAAMFFALQPADGIVGDTNYDLINYYRVLANSTESLIRALLGMRASRETYYSLRAILPADSFERAVRFAYLNRLCWNGVYRVNRYGHFNVPIGDRLPVVMWDTSHLRSCARILRSARLVCQDFAITADEAQAGDLVFFDPPYPKGVFRGQGFNRYTAVPFQHRDFERLANTIECLHDRDVHIMVATSTDDPNRATYPSLLKPTVVQSQSLISGSNGGRRPTVELVLRNYGD